MKDKGMSCAVCGYDAGMSRYWWVLNAKLRWHELRGGKAHRESLAAWREDEEEQG